jgi:hypothetical protein
LHRLGPCLTALVCAAVLAGCGGAGEEPAEEPTLPSELSSELASRSDAVADAYAAGDVCGAAQRADELLAAVEAAIEQGRVPPELREPLTASAIELVAEINCPAETPAPPQEDGDPCAELVQQKEALEEQRSDAEGEGVQDALDEQIASLEDQIEACRERSEGDGDDEDDDD